MKPKVVLNKLKPLFHDPAGYMVFGAGNALYRRSELGKLELLVALPESRKKKVLAISTWVYRLARMGFGCGAFFQGRYFFTHGANLYSYNPARPELRCEFRFRVGRGPLSFAVVEGVEGFEDGIYFGEYFGNRQRAPVNVYKRDSSGEWTVVYTFASGEINHVHSLVADPLRNCIWILAGDFEHSASIWKVGRSFSVVQPVLRGEQVHRSCVAFPLTQGLLYATDTQITGNSIRLLREHAGVWKSELVLNINGSCIYGCELKDYFVFSTATEPSDDISNKYLSLFDRRPGPGIIKNQSDVLAVRKSDLSCVLLYSKKKDFLPYRLFQFGAIMFPHGKGRDNTLYSYSVGNAGNDLCTEIYHMDSK